MADHLNTFTFEGRALRVVLRDGEPWWIAADVCAVLDLGNPRQAIVRLDDDEKGVISNDTPGGPQQANIINESGLYSLVLGSRKPESRRFKKWVTSEVLPAIRRTGTYSVVPLQPQQPESFRVSGMDLVVPRSFPDALRALAQVAERAEDQHREIQVLQPKAAFHDAVNDASGAQSIQEVAKVLGTGQNRLFTWLRDQHILLPSNLPYQEYMDRGYFKVVERTWKDAEGEPHLTTKTLVTGKGLAWLQKRYSQPPATVEEVAVMLGICFRVASNLLERGWRMKPVITDPPRWDRQEVMRAWAQIPEETQERYRGVE